MTAFKALGVVLLDASSDEPSADLLSRLFEQVPREELEERLSEIDEWVSGKRSDVFHGVARRHGNLRKFSRSFFEALELQGVRDSACLRALEVLRAVNKAGKRKLGYQADRCGNAR